MPPCDGRLMFVVPPDSLELERTVAGSGFVARCWRRTHLRSARYELMREYRVLLPARVHSLHRVGRAAPGHEYGGAPARRPSEFG